MTATEHQRFISCLIIQDEFYIITIYTIGWGVVYGQFSLCITLPH